jgi:hypothetical protein
MQNLPDKGVSGCRHYLQADGTSTRLTRSALGSQDESETNGKAIPILEHGFLRMSELQSSLKRDHSWTAIAAQTDAQ